VIKDGNMEAFALVGVSDLVQRLDSPRHGGLKLVTRDLSASEDIGWSNYMLVWNVVVYMSSIVYRHWP
jgi:hypothetical protein